MKHLPSEVQTDFDVSNSKGDDGTVVVNLSFPAKPEYNGSEILCVVVSTNVSKSDKSKNATLTIQGNV